MRIGVNTRLLLPGTLEGIGRFSKEVLSRMALQHPEDEFVFFFDRPFDQKFIFANNVTPIILAPQSRHPVMWYLWFEKIVSKAIINQKVDVFFSPELYCCLSVDTPTIMIAHDLAYLHYPDHIPFSHLTYHKYFVPRFLQRADMVGAVSEATMNDLIDNFKVEKEKFFLAYNGPTPGFIPLDHPSKESVLNSVTGGAPYFIYLGSMHPRKNVDAVIKAYGKFRDNHPGAMHKLVLVGRLAWKSSKIKQAYEQSPYKEDILPLGQRADANKILAAAEALIYVSLFEGFGIPIIEAMQCDVPVITSNVSSMPEVAGKGALLVDPMRIGGISDAMSKVLDPTVKESLIKEGQKRLARYSWEKTSEIVYQNIRSCITE